MKLVGIVFIVAMIFLGCSKVQAEGMNWYKDFNQAKEMAKAENKPMLLDFYTDWCGWCKRLDKDTYGNEEVIKLSQQFVCVKVNAEENQQLAKTYNVRGFPTTVFLNPEGSLIAAVPGYMPPADFLSQMKSVLAQSGK